MLDLESFVSKKEAILSVFTNEIYLSSDLVVGMEFRGMGDHRHDCKILELGNFMSAHKLSNFVSLSTPTQDFSHFFGKETSRFLKWQL